MAPVTRSQAAPGQHNHQVPPAMGSSSSSRSSEQSPGSVDFTLLLPTELTACILEQLLPDYADVARASVVCKRIASLATCRLWRSLFVSRWGPATPAQEDAAVLAGSWRALFRSKHDTDAASAGWTRPCEFELRATLRRLASRAASAAASDPTPAPGQNKAKVNDPPSTPAGPLSAAASVALSPAPSNASSMSVSLGSSPPRSSGSSLSSPFVHAGAGGGGGASSSAGAGAASLHRVSSSISSAAQTSSSPPRSTTLMAPPSWGAGGSSRQAPSPSSSLALSDVERTPGAASAPALPPPPEVQLVYLLDGSGSVSEDDFAEMRKFVVMSANIICSSLGSLEQGKVGVIQFSTEPRVEVPLTSLGNDGAAQLSAALDNMVRMNGGTNIATAIARAGALLKAHDQQQVGGIAPPDGALPPPPPPPLLGPLPLLVDAHLPAELALMEALQEDEDEDDEVLPAAMLPVPPHMDVAGPPAPPGGAAAEAVGGAPGAGARPVRLLLILTDGRVDTYQAREARLNACRLADELWGCTLAAFGVGRGVDRSELLHIIDTPQGDAASRYLDLYTRDDAPW